jgi:hypothetical protein
MPNRIDLGLTVFTQWRAQQGGGILRPSGSVVSVSKYFSVTVTVKVNNLFSSYSYS